jgi:phage/plasmid primase-like uncharacterized protein
LEWVFKSKRRCARRVRTPCKSWFDPLDNQAAAKVVTRKQDCFHAVGGLDAMARAPALVIAEGYATAVTLCEALGFATMAAFDSGNLRAMARALQGRSPDKPIVIAGDDDQHLVDTLGKSPGREKMEQAAVAVNAAKLLSVFAPGEWDARSGVFTDFNDLATKSVLGREGVER